MNKRINNSEKSKIVTALSDDELVLRIKLGETSLFEKIMRRYNQRLYRIARGMGIPDKDCDDLIQQAYIKAFGNLAAFKGNSRFSTWLIRIFINECLMNKRKNQIFIDDSMNIYPESLEKAFNMTNLTPENTLISKELTMLLEEAVSYLPSDYKTVYIMREIEEMSVKETAACLSITESNVKIRLFRAKTMLRNYLERYMKPSEIFEFGNQRCDNLVIRVMNYLTKSIND